MVLEEGHGYEICLRTCTDVSPDNRDNKDASRTIRTGFMGKFVVSHDTLKVTERCFFMDESLHKGHLAWLLLIQFLHFNDTETLRILQLSLGMFEDIFCWQI